MTWSKSLLPDEALDPDCLVARLLKTRFTLGQWWCRRDGRIVQITEVDPGTTYPIGSHFPGICHNIHWHRPDGTSCIDQSGADLIELVSAPEASDSPASELESEAQP